jgi:alpha-glucuronidase
MGTRKTKNINLWLLIFFILTTVNFIYADDGYRLWLKYDLISDVDLLKIYRDQIQAIIFEGESTTIQIAKNELKSGLIGLLGKDISQVNNIEDGIVLVGTLNHFPQFQNSDLKTKVAKVGKEGFVISNEKVEGRKVILISANNDIGVLYGVFHFLRLLQTHQDISNLNIISFPKTQLRMLNHWDMLNGVHEYSGLLSIWDWHTLPKYIKPEYIYYARANASIGINAIVPNNVDADPLFLTDENLLKVAALADVFRPYGIKVFLCPNFISPIKLSGMKTADPLDPKVKEWWKQRINEIYKLVPDFGGFLVKANSEDEPGPGDFHRSQADGANMFAEALKPYGGLVIWRTFVYRYDPEDRAKEAYDIFKPLDGKFADNVILQVKNGPLDFSPREPFSPLFGAMLNTPLIMEVDITMGGLGKDVYLGYMAPMWRETLMSDTYSNGEGSTVAKVIDGSLVNKIGGMAGVANIYRERNWTGNIFGQANWYTFGRLSWDYNITSEQIAEEWIRMTFSNDTSIINPTKKIMMGSRENIVNFQDPLGLNMLMGWGGFRGPWTNNSEHTNWNSPYYHRADSIGIGFNRTETGSKAVDQYFPPVAEKFNSLKTCPEKFLLWFHHVPWTYKLKSGNTLWDEICYHYYQGVKDVKKMQNIWNSLEGKIDKERFNLVSAYLKIEYDDAINWRDGCIMYFQTFSHMPIPEELEKPEHDLEYYIISMSRDKIAARKMAIEILQKIDKK